MGMDTQPIVWKHKLLYYMLIVLSSLGFMVLLLSYRNVTLGARLSIAVGEILVWFVAATVAVKVKNYALSLDGEADGRAINTIANGLLWLVVYIISLSVATDFAAVFYGTSWSSLATMIHNHLPVIFIIISTLFLYKGADSLNRIAPQVIWDSRRIIFGIVLSSILVSIFAWRFYTIAPTLVDGIDRPRFALSASALMFTYVLPHIIVWILGGLACINLANYGMKIKGVLYRKFFQDLYKGLLLIYMCTFFGQALIVTTNSDNISSNLLPIFAVILLSVYGYWLTFRGTSRLVLLDNLR